MHPIVVLIAAAAVPASESPLDVSAEAIVVTAAREPLARDTSLVSATVFDESLLDRLAFPLVADVLRLAPGVSVSTTGPRGTQTQLRIRGAEANHTLLFVDGIRFNDPAAGSNEARFELLAVDALARLEVVRGPQSALWGSEALGGVVAAETTDPLRPTNVQALAEYGSLDSARASAQFSRRIGDFGIGATAGWIRSDGLDSFGDGGERDGFENRAASAKLVFAPSPAKQIGLVGHWIEGESEFDGFDPLSFRRADTLDATSNRMYALRGWGEISSEGPSPWSASLNASLVDSRNRNRLDREPLNTTVGRRLHLAGQLSKAVRLGNGSHKLIGAIEHEIEDFDAHDYQYGGAGDQQRSRKLTAFVGEWRADWSSRVATDLAIRHDDFSAFADATTVRLSLSIRPTKDLILHAAFGEGIAQPTFYDLYGFFPGSFLGNPTLRPESSAGWEAGLRWERGGSRLAIAGFTNLLADEIVDVFDPETFLSSTANVEGKSRRRGIEVEASHRIGAVALDANYTYLDAGQRQTADAKPIREVRRPRHSANLIASGSLGPVDLGVAFAYIGKRTDSDFDLNPAQRVTLGSYLLGSLNLAWRITPDIEAYTRIENALGADYEDVVGYQTAGRTIYAGARLRLGD